MHKNIDSFEFGSRSFPPIYYTALPTPNLELLVPRTLKITLEMDHCYPFEIYIS
jgi:hypothetical protein